MINSTPRYGLPANPVAFGSYYAIKHLPMAAKIKWTTCQKLTKFTNSPDFKSEVKKGGFKMVLFFTLCLMVCGTDLDAENPDMTRLLPKIAAEKNDSSRFYLAFSGLTISETNPVLDMHNAEQLLVYAKKNKDAVCEVLGLGCLGYDYRAFGSTAKSLEYNLMANAVADKSKDDRLISAVKIGLATNYLDLGDFQKATSYGLSGLLSASRIEVNIFTIIGNLTLGEIYLKMNKIDSALFYTQRAYELSMNTGIKDYLGGIYGQLGSIHSSLNKPTLAISYFNLALEEAVKVNSPKYINISYFAIAEYYSSTNQIDSAMVYAKKAIAAVQKTAFSTLSIKPAKMLLDIYRNTNIDSAFKYSEIHRIVNDSLFNIKAIQQTQLMTFEEGARQQELAVERIKSEEQRRQNIQSALIALGIITFITFFLLLSRSFITNARAIEFLGVISLLIVFEFLNLMLHPFLEKITHHSPALMLLALVCIAALLVPLHHKLQQWTTVKLVEKNKEVRLARARKTIEKLS
jgi:tetratricopeptide (TPR) repeat protein